MDKELLQNSVEKQVFLVQLGNRLKQKVKKLLGQLDQTRSGVVQDKAFLQILELNGIKLSASVAKTLLRTCQSSSAYSQHVTQGGLFVHFKEALKMIHIDAENSTTGHELTDLKWVVRDIVRGSPSPMNRTGGFTSQSQYEKEKRARTPMLDRKDSQPRKYNNITLNTIENMDARAREDIAMTERNSQTAEPSIRRSIGSQGSVEQGE